MKKILKIIMLCLISMLLLVSCGNDETTSGTNKLSKTISDYEINSDDLNIIENMISSNDSKVRFSYDFQVGFDNEINLVNSSVSNSSILPKHVEMDFDEIMLSNVTIYFDKDIDIDSRIKFAKKVYEIIDIVNSRYELANSLEFYVTDKFNSCVIENKNFIKYDENMSLDDISIQILLGIFGENTNYGLIYAESKDVLKNIIYHEYTESKFSFDDAIKEIKKNDCILDLTYANFTREYASRVEISAAKVISISFSEYIIDKYGREEYLKFIEDSSEFSSEFDDKYNIYMNEFLITKHIDIQRDQPSSVIRVSKLGGDVFKVNIATEWFQYRFAYDYQKLWNDCGHNYRDISNYIYRVEKQNKDIRDYWQEKISPNYKYTKAYFVNSLGKNLGGYCDVKFRYIVICDSNALNHEYTHYLYRMDETLEELDTTSRALLEGRAIFSQIPSDINIYKELYNFFYKNGIPYPKYNNGNECKYKEIFDKYMKSIGKEKIDEDDFKNADIRYDYLELCSYCTLKNERMDRNSVYYTYGFGTVLTKYIIDNFGLDKYKKIYYNQSNIYELCDQKTIYDLEKDVMNYLDNKYEKFYDAYMNK